MDILEVMKARHSVRQYENKVIEADKRKQLENKIHAINEANHLHIQIFFEEPTCFDSMMAHYGKFTGVRNYISLVGPKGKTLEETLGYYGEELVLLAQSLGLNTCWVALTHGKSKAVINKNEKQVCLIALGYGSNSGYEHTSKPVDQLFEIIGDKPDWFNTAMEAVLLAPTAMNQQKFLFTVQNDNVSLKGNGLGFYSHVDLGIVKYHFEAITGVKVQS